MNGKYNLHWHWMPVFVFLIGVASIGLLVSINHINDQMREGYVLSDVIEDMEIRTANFHLWLEEYIAGDENAGRKNPWEYYEEAVGLVNTIINGGKVSDGYILAPLTDPELLSRAEKLNSLLADFKTIGLIRLKDPAAGKIGSVLDEQFDNLYFKILGKAGELEQLFEAKKVSNISHSKKLYWAILLSWTTIVVIATLGLFNRERRRKAADQELLQVNHQLSSQAAELTEHRQHLAEQVNIRTRELVDANSSLEAEIAERQRTEEKLLDSHSKLTYLSSMLLTAQEDERRKISRELHDGVGQALTVMKLRLRAHKRQLQLSEDHKPLWDDCEDMLSYIKTIMEDVRRMSRDLCPSILEDLGLTRALTWLVQDFEKSNDIRLSVDLADVDGLFAKKDQTSIYRLVQESLNNIAKHSGAVNASVTVRRFEDSAVFFIEDDGKGFDVAETTAKKAPDKGLGLASMQERVNILGGLLELRSDREKGTRISFTIPAKEVKEVHEHLSTLAG